MRARIEFGNDRIYVLGWLLGGHWTSDAPNELFGQQFLAGTRVREQVLGSFAVHPGFIAALVLLLVLGFTICVDLFQCVTVSGSLQDVVPSWGHPRVSMVARCICPVHAHSEIQRRAQHSRSHAAVR